MVPRLKLHTSFDDGCCFTVAFSPSGHLCAVASQAGVITVFDAKRILASRHASSCALGGPVICRLTSTRSFGEGGAVRSMAFAPTPLDLLVWVEEFGRVAVVDLRQMMARRQVLELDIWPSEHLERLSVTEYTLGEADSSDSSDRERETSPEWRRPEHEPVSNLMEYLDDSHDTPRPRRYTPTRRNPGRNPGDGNDEENATLVQPYSINYFRSQRSTYELASEVIRRYLPSDSTTSHTPESSMYRHRDPTFRDYIRERSRMSDRTSFQPRRRRSQILSDEPPRQNTTDERNRTIWEGATPFLESTGRPAEEASDTRRRRPDANTIAAAHSGPGATNNGSGRASLSALYASVVSTSPDEEETNRNSTTQSTMTANNGTGTTRRPATHSRPSEDGPSAPTLAEFSAAERAEIMREVLAERRRRQRQYQESSGTWNTPPLDSTTPPNVTTTASEALERDALRDQLTLEQARSLRLRQMLEVMERSRANAPADGSREPPILGGIRRHGVGTAGIGWSRNGNDLWVLSIARMIRLECLC